MFFLPQIDSLTLKPQHPCWSNDTGFITFYNENDAYSVYVEYEYVCTTLDTVNQLQGVTESITTEAVVM